MDERREELSMEDVLSSIDEIRGRVGEVVRGVVLEKSEDGLLVDFQGKAEGIVPTSELIRSPDSYSVGEELTLQIIRIDDEEGRIVLSERRPKYREVLRKVEEIFSGDSKIVKGRIIGRVKGGYRVLIDGVLEAFLPGSHSLIKASDVLPKDEMEFEIISFESRGRRPNIVLSRRTLRDKKIAEFLENLNVGDDVEGTIESIQPFGVFVELVEGLSGLLPRSEVSHTAVADLKDMFEVGQRIKLRVINIDPEQRKVTLSLKAMVPDPWEVFVEDHKVGDRVSGTVTAIRPFGFLVKLAEGVEGVVPVEEVFWNPKRGNLRSVARVGDVLETEIIEIDPDRRRIVLSYKRAKGDPWENVEEKYPIGSEVEGRVVSVLPTGAIVELEDGVAGFVPKGELSWNFFEKTEEVVKPRRRVKTKVLDIDKENKRMRLSIKRAQRNPWDRVFSELKRGDVVQGRVRKLVNSGAIVYLSKYGVDAFLPNGHFDELKEGDRVEAVVLRVIQDSNRPRMIISVKELEEFKALEEYRKRLESEMPSRNLGEIIKRGEENGRGNHSG